MAKQKGTTSIRIKVPTHRRIASKQAAWKLQRGTLDEPTIDEIVSAALDVLDAAERTPHANGHISRHAAQQQVQA